MAKIKIGALNMNSARDDYKLMEVKQLDARDTALRTMWQVA